MKNMVLGIFKLHRYFSEKYVLIFIILLTLYVVKCKASEGNFRVGSNKKLTLNIN